MTDAYGATIVTLDDPNALAHEGARRFVAAFQAAAGQASFRVALSGGSTPKALYETLSQEPYRSQVDWSRVQVFFSDERFVPPDSPESNYGMAREALLDRVVIPQRCVHTVPTATDNPEESAALYEQTIRNVFGTADGVLPRFDLLLLGLGPDGHTASLFPGTKALGERERIVVANYLDRQNTWRITFTYPLINAARCVTFLAQGAEKASRVREVLEHRDDLPAAHVRPEPGQLVWLLDRTAAAELPATP